MPDSIALVAKVCRSASFANSASVPNSAEYEIIREFSATHLERPIKLADKKTSNNRPLKLSVKQMGEFIAKCRDAKDRTARFEQVKALSKVQPSPY